METTLLETCLFENAAQGAWSQVIAGLAGNGDSPGFLQMLELPMASAGGHEKPTILGKQSEHFADFHAPRLAGESKFTKWQEGTGQGDSCCDITKL